MAYIRIDKDMTSDPRLLTLAEDLADLVAISQGADALDGNALRNVLRNALLGSLVTLWCYADTHIRVDNTLPIKVRALSDMIGLPVEWIEQFPVEWLIVHANGTVELVDYCEKNGLIAKEKRREQGRDRVRKFREKKAKKGAADTPPVTDDVTQPVTHPVTPGNATPPVPGPNPKPNPLSINQPSPEGVSEPFPMRPDWEQSPHFGEIARLSGFLMPGTAEFEAARAEFVAYWLTQEGTTRTQHEWDHALLKNLKAGKLRDGQKPVQRSPRAPASDDFNNKNYGSGGAL